LNIVAKEMLVENGGRALGLGWTDPSLGAAFLSAASGKTDAGCYQEYSPSPHSRGANIAAQWRAADNAPYATGTQSARPLPLPG
jgi:hypothetical protein